LRDWAAENPDEVLLVHQTAGDRALHELLKQERELGHQVRSARRYKKSPDELASLLAEVPF
jgi:hypothetical protein